MRDRHTSDLVNRLIDTLRALVDEGAEITILCGNHDRPLYSVKPYWSFLSNIPGVTFIREPTTDGQLLLLPYSDNPTEEWQDIDFRNYNCVFMHQTLDGADIGGGRPYHSRKKPLVIQAPTGLKIYSGDVHVPQELRIGSGTLTYVGAPHYIKHGDNYPTRMLRIDNTTYEIIEDIPLIVPGKHMIEVASLDELKQLDIKPGDRAKVRLTMPIGEIEHWPQEQALINEWARDNDVEVVSIEPIVQMGERTDSNTDATDPIANLITFAQAEGLEEPVLVAGLELLEQAKGTIRYSPINELGRGLVVLVAVTITAFRCFRETVTIEFPTEGGLRYLSGKNEVEPRLGANGTGKSTILDAIYWALYGVSVRGQIASALSPWGTSARPNVVVCLSIADTVQIIERTGSPDTLLLNGQPVSQATIDSLVGMPKDRFLHSVIFGQASPLFMDMAVPARGEMLGSVFNLDVWTDMAEYAGKVADDTKKQTADVYNKLQRIGDYIKMYDNQAAALTADELAWGNERQSVLDNMNKLYDTAYAKMETANQQLHKAEQSMPGPLDFSELENEVRLKRNEQRLVFSAKERAAHQLKNIQDQIDFFKHSNECPTCGQGINRTFKSTRVTELEQEKADCEYDTEQNSASEQQINATVVKLERDLKNLNEQRYTATGHIVATRSEVASCQRELQRITDTIKHLNTQTNPITQRIIELVAQLEAATATEQTLDAEHSKLSSDHVLWEYWQKGFKRVRLFFTRRVLATLELETAAAAASLGVGQWQIKFATERETASGTTRPGIYVTATNPQHQGDYKSYSFGETQRVRLSVTLGLASLIQSMAGVYYGFEWWDEPTTWLSNEGIDDLINALQHRADTTGRAVWLLDHRTTSHPFDEVWQVTKTIQGSTVQQIR